MSRIRKAYVEEDEPEDTEMSISLDEVPVDTNYQIRTSAGVSEKASSVLAQLERKKFANTIAVPTDDKRVRSRLREIGEPITLFGEGLAERRDRLREILTQRAEEADGDVRMEDGIPAEDVDEAEEEFYTEGTPALLVARKYLAEYTMARAQKRMLFQKAEHTIPLRAHVKHRKAIKERLHEFDLYGSQVAADRPLGTVRFSPGGETLATGTWSGAIKILDVPNLEEQLLLRGHTEVVSGVCWVPGATLPSSNVSPSGVNLVSGGGEGNIHLWSLEQDTPLATLSGHEARVAKVDIHPTKKYIASASHDMTWRLWDIETTTELQLQEGHSREVHAIAFNVDGSLVASAGMDSVGRIWDIRTGRMAMFLDAHIQPVHTVDWGTDGYRVLTGSADGYIKCWDIRNIKEVASIGAHSNGVTDVRWFKGTDGPGSCELPYKDERDEYVPKKSGTFVVSVGFDKTVKIWSADDWAICRTVSGHSSNITGVDITDDSKWIASCSRDRTVKLWQRDDGEAV